MLDDIARETDVGVFYSFTGPVEIIIFHFLSLCPFPFRFIQPFHSQKFPQSERFAKTVPKFVFEKAKKRMVPCDSTLQEVSFEWLHQGK